MLKHSLKTWPMLLVLLFNQGLIGRTGQTTVQMPKRFEIYYEIGIGVSNSNSVSSGSYDAFDSEKKQRVFDAFGGQVSYPAELSDNERLRIYQAISDNKLFDIKDDFTNLGNVFVHPNIVGRLQIDVDGRIKEVRFKRACSRLMTRGTVTTCDSDWTRLQNVLDVIEGILKTKDLKQPLPRHKIYA